MFLHLLEDDLYRFGCTIFRAPDDDGGSAGAPSDDPETVDDEPEVEPEPEKAKDTKKRDEKTPYFKSEAAREAWERMAEEDRRALFDDLHGLKSANEQIRKENRELERKLEDEARERKAKEEAKLEEEGKWKEIADKKAKELEKVRAEAKAIAHRQNILSRASEAERTEAGKLFLMPRGEDDFDTFLETFDAAVQEVAEREIAKRIGTKKRPVGGGDNNETENKSNDGLLVYPSMEK